MRTSGNLNIESHRNSNSAEAFEMPRYLKCYESKLLEENIIDDAFARKVPKPWHLGKHRRGPDADTVKLKEAVEMCTLKAPWLNRLDLVNNFAPLASVLAIHIEKHQQKRENQLKVNRKTSHVAAASDPVLNDFTREMIFHRQAQWAAIEGIRRLHELGVATNRPKNYFAEMAKSDERMRNICKKLQDQQEGMRKSERMRQLRDLRGIGKLAQRYTNQNRDVERRTVLNRTKKFCEGKLTNLDILNDVRMEQDGLRESHKKNTHRRKLGFGGRKVALQRNTEDSRTPETHQRKKRANAKRNRPGKIRRAQEKSRRGSTLGA